MGKPITQFEDSSGAKFDATEVIKGIVEVWGKEDIVSQINGPVSAEAVKDETGEIVRYRYFINSFSNIVDRKTLVAEDRDGAVKGKDIVMEEVTVDLDDERSTEVTYIDNWDANKLANRINLKASKQGEYPILSKTERAERFFEALRIAAKTAEAAGLGDGVTRVVDLPFDSDELSTVTALQDAIDELVDLKNSRAKGTNRAFIFLAVPPKVLTKISNTQAFTGSNIAGQALAEGAVGKLNGVMIYETINSAGIAYVGVRGAAVVPIANAEIVDYPAKSNAWKGAFEWSLPKQGSEGILYGDRVIAIGPKADIEA